MSCRGLSASAICSSDLRPNPIEVCGIICWRPPVEVDCFDASATRARVPTEGCTAELRYLDHPRGDDIALSHAWG
jgi:hypothetical protein